MWEYNGCKMDLDMEDYDTAARYMEAAQLLGEKSALYYDGLKDGTISGAQIIRQYAEAYYHYFDYLFGPGTGDKLFGGKHNSRMCDEATLSLLEYVTSMQEETRKRREKMQAYLPKSRV